MRRVNRVRANRSIRLKPYKPWSSLIPVDIPPEAMESNVVACFQNHLITVFAAYVKLLMDDFHFCLLHLFNNFNAQKLT